MSSSSPTTCRVLITIGSTKFDALIHRVLQEDTLQAFRQAGFTDVAVQCGNSVLPSPWTTSTDTDVNGLHIELWTFKPSLRGEISSAELIISHAGSGTIIDTLRLRKKLIVIPNDTLLDGHQSELSEALGAQGYLIAGTVDTLKDAILSASSFSPKPFPPFNGTAFRDLLDEELNFV